MTTEISFVVPTRDSARTIEACLRSLALQGGARTETIVVDNHSTDRTGAVARRYADRFVVAGPERAAQRNLGARLATGDILVFVDSDMVVEPRVARECVAALSADPGLGAVIVPERSFGTGFLARCRELEKELYLGDPRVEAARVFRRAAFDAAGGYDEAITAFEDWDLPDRVGALGYAIGRVTSGIWHDEGRISLVAQARKKRYYGRRSDGYLTRRGSRRAICRPSLWRAPARLAGRPDRAFGLAVLKGVEVAALALGAGEAAWARRRRDRRVSAPVTGRGGRRGGG